MVFVTFLDIVQQILFYLTSEDTNNSTHNNLCSVGHQIILLDISSIDTELSLLHM